MKAILIHISDSHFRDSNREVAGRYRQIVASLRNVVGSVESIFIVYTGDITQSGRAEEFALAKQFLDGLSEQLRLETGKSVDVIVTAGNHDGMFKDSTSTRATIIGQIRQDNSKASDHDYIKTCTEPLAHYYEFERTVAARGVTFESKLWRDYTFQVGSRSVRFSALNASWMSTVPETQGELIFPITSFSEVVEAAASLNILLLHHPLNWYAQSTYHPLRQMVRTHYQLVMSGHEHTDNAQMVSDFHNNTVAMLEAPAFSHQASSEFSVILLDLDADAMAQESFFWEDDRYVPRGGAAYWDNFVPIPERKMKNGFHLTDAARQRLGALDASFSHPRKEHVQLADVFVYPDLVETESENEIPETLSAELLLQVDNPKYPKSIVYGDEQYGKTSLLKHLFMGFHSLGQVPVLIDALDATGNSGHFLRVLDRKIEELYGPAAKVKFSQTSHGQKVALVDNLDSISRGDVLARALSNIESQFGRVVLAAGERYEVTVLSSSDAASAVSEYVGLKMLGFGFKLRRDLITRWYRIGQDFDQQELQEKVFRAEQTINSVLGKGLVPMTAFNSLVLLQTIEVNEKGSLANAGMAQYYEYMFRQSLMASKARADELDEIQSYLVYLAWEMYTQETKHLNQEKFLKFNSWFSDHVHKTDVLTRLKLLLDSRILTERHDGYAFAYGYLDYFFVAKYLAMHCEDRPELKDIIKHMCRHLYLKDNANIVLFLTHHLPAGWVIKEIAGLLSSILNEVVALRLEDDTRLINTWVNEHAKIVVDTSNVDQNNRKFRESEDAAAKLPEKTQTNEVSSIKELDQLTQLNLLFKTSEILGQILKGRYGSIVKGVKEDLMRHLFDAPLRGINFFIKLVESEPEALLMDVASRLQHANPNVAKEKADLIAKRYIFAVLGNVADSFTSRQGEIIGSPKLVDTIDQVASNGGMAYELVAVAAKLSYPNHPPIDQIKSLADRLENNYFGQKLLQGLVARHLYMFSLQNADRSRLAATVSIDVQEQRDIEMKSHAQRKLPGRSSRPRNAQTLISRLQHSFLVRNKGVLDEVATRYKKKKDESET